MIRFSEEKVLLLHQLLIAETGGSAELRDVSCLTAHLKEFSRRLTVLSCTQPRKKRRATWLLTDFESCICR